MSTVAEEFEVDTERPEISTTYIDGNGVLQYKLDKVTIASLTMRDGGQTSRATRDRIEDKLKFAELHAKAGFKVNEVWGGATFDVNLRFLGENPFDNLTAIKNALNKSLKGFKDNFVKRFYANKRKLQKFFTSGLLRGDCLTNYDNNPTSTTKRFIKQTALAGLDSAYIFDAWNSEVNIVEQALACNENKVHAQLCLSYTTKFDNEGNDYLLTHPDTGEVFNLGGDNTEEDLEKYVEFVKRTFALAKSKGGHFDSIRIKDPAGNSTPQSIAYLTRRLREEFPDKAIALHRHRTYGDLFREETKDVARAFLENGGHIIDVAPGDTHNGIMDTYEIAKAVRGAENVTQLDNDTVEEIEAYDRKMNEKCSDFTVDHELLKKIDPVLLRQCALPGGMYTNFQNQMKKLDIEPTLQNLENVLQRFLAYRKRLDTGMTPVTPLSKIIGDQAIWDFMKERDALKSYKNTHKAKFQDIKDALLPKASEMLARYYNLEVEHVKQHFEHYLKHTSQAVLERFQKEFADSVTSLQSYPGVQDNRLGLLKAVGPALIFANAEQSAALIDQKAQELAQQELDNEPKPIQFKLGMAKTVLGTMAKIDRYKIDQALQNLALARIDKIIQLAISEKEDIDLLKKVRETKRPVSVRPSDFVKSKYEESKEALIADSFDHQLAIPEDKDEKERLILFIEMFGKVGRKFIRFSKNRKLFQKFMSDPSEDLESHPLGTTDHLPKNNVIEIARDKKGKIKTRSDGFADIKLTDFVLDTNDKAAVTRYIKEKYPKRAGALLVAYDLSPESLVESLRTGNDGSHGRHNAIVLKSRR